MDTVIFPSTGKVGDELSPCIGKSDKLSQKCLGKSAVNFNIYWSLFLALEYSDKNLLLAYLNCYADRYPTYQ
jgi:hypothetical protein